MPSAARSRTSPRRYRAPEDGRRTTRSFALVPPPQKKRSAPSDSSPDTPTPAGMSRRSRTSPVSASMRRSSPGEVARDERNLGLGDRAARGLGAGLRAERPRGVAQEGAGPVEHAELRHREAAQRE